MNLEERSRRIRALVTDRGLSQSLAEQMHQNADESMIAEVEAASDADIAQLNTMGEAAGDFDRVQRQFDEIDLKPYLEQIDANIKALAGASGAPEDLIGTRKGDATLTIEPRPVAERLRIRKGHTLRWTGFDGKPQDFRVTYVSMPDSWGRCEVRCEEVVADGNP